MILFKIGYGSAAVSQRPIGWDQIYRTLRVFPGLYIRQEAATRHFIENVLWVAGAAAPGVCYWRNTVLGTGSTSAYPLADNGRLASIAHGLER
ncbi:MAG: hypothetical protein ACRBM6_38100, partial [Geminicoccales bacterium]